MEAASVGPTSWPVVVAAGSNGGGGRGLLELAKTGAGVGKAPGRQFDAEAIERLPDLLFHGVCGHGVPPKRLRSLIIYGGGLSGTDLLAGRRRCGLKRATIRLARRRCAPGRPNRDRLRREP